MGATYDPAVEISAFDGGLELYKRPRSWERDLEVKISVGGGSGAFRVEKFPRDMDQLTISDLDPESMLDVKVQSRNVLRRVKRGTATFRIQPRPRPFQVVITGSGRCGTTTLAKYFDGMSFSDGEEAVARHETLHEYFLPWIIEGNHDAIRRLSSGMPHNIESAPYYALVPQLITADTVIHLVRDGRRVCQSGINRGWYETGTIWNRVKPQFEGPNFARICRYWRHTNEQVETISDIFVRLEDLSSSEDEQQKLLDQLGLHANGRIFPHTNKGKAPSVFDSWTDEMKETFTDICGEMMDRYYPGWRETW